MSKAVLISIRPKWCELIASGKKTVEVRKTKPKLKTPFKCYLYCTINGITAAERDRNIFTDFRGKIIGEFVCDRISPVAMTTDGLVDAVDLKTSCLSVQELLLYSGGKLPLYGWHISDLVIYDKPKALSEFRSYDCSVVWRGGYPIPTHEIKRAPQSWSYVMEGKNNEDS